MSSTTTYIVGQEVRVAGEFRDIDNTLVDPTGVLFKFIKPSGVLTTYTYLVDEEVVRDETGKYHVDIYADQVGLYNWRWESSGGTVTAADGSFQVENSAFDNFLDIVPETGSGASTSNSYASIQEAVEYFQTHLYASVWFDTDYQDKTAALIWATRLLDQEVHWNGSKKSEEQALQFPRIGLVDREGYELTGVPAFLKNATAELALHLLQCDLTKDPDTKGFSRMQIGRLNVETDKFDRAGILPRSVIAMIREYGEIASSRKSSVKLERV